MVLKKVLQQEAESILSNSRQHREIEAESNFGHALVLEFVAVAGHCGDILPLLDDKRRQFAGSILSPTRISMFSNFFLEIHY